MLSVYLHRKWKQYSFFPLFLKMYIYYIRVFHEIQLKTSSKVVYDAVEEIIPFMMEVLPGPKKRHEIEIDHNYLLEVLLETAYN